VNYIKMEKESEIIFAMLCAVFLGLFYTAIMSSIYSHWALLLLIPYALIWYGLLEWAKRIVRRRK